MLDGDLAELRRIIQFDAATNRLYFETLERIALAMLRFVELEHPGRADFVFRSAIAALEDAERHENIKGDVYESELRAHRASLEALRKRAEESYLQIDAAELVTCTHSRSRAGAAGRSTPRKPSPVRSKASGRGTNRKGFRPKKARELELNDLWDRLDVSELGYSYSGATIELAPITVKTMAMSAEDEPLEFQAEVRRADSETTSFASGLVSPMRACTTSIRCCAAGHTAWARRSSRPTA